MYAIFQRIRKTSDKSGKHVVLKSRLSLGEANGMLEAMKKKVAKAYKVRDNGTSFSYAVRKVENNVIVVYRKTYSIKEYNG